MDIEVTLVNSFTKNGAGGNPAGVVLNADHLSNDQKLKIAQAVGFSETAFVSCDDAADYEVSFFTITDEVDFCGHATLAAFSTMYEKGMLTAGAYLQRTKAGTLVVDVKASGKVIMEQKLPQKLASFSYQEIAQLIGIECDVLASTTLPIQVISTGLADAIIAVPHGCLDSIQPADKAISEFCKKNKIVGFHVFELCNQESTLTASCRNFAPLFGITEESATGSSNGALACYLSEHLSLGSEYVFEQGRAMGCASIIEASITSNGSAISDVKVGGFTRIIDTVMVYIE